MPGASRERNEKLGAAALDFIKAGDYPIADPEFRVSKAMAVAFAAANGCIDQTARRHLIFAVAYLRNGAQAVPPGWGGVRPYQPGRPRKVVAAENTKGD